MWTRTGPFRKADDIGEKALWCEVIRWAVVEANSTNTRLRNDARAWLRGEERNGDDLRAVCEMAGIDATAILDWARKKFEARTYEQNVGTALADGRSRNPAAPGDGFLSWSSALAGPSS